MQAQIELTMAAPTRKVQAARNPLATRKAAAVRPAKLAKPTKPAKLLTRLLAGYVVYVSYSNDRPVAKHYARNWAEVLEWLRCYGPNDKFTVYERLLGCTALYPCAARAGRM